MMGIQPTSGFTSTHPVMQRCSAWMRKRPFSPWIGLTRSCLLIRGVPSGMADHGFTYVSIGRPASYNTHQGRPRTLLL